MSTSVIEWLRSPEGEAWSTHNAWVRQITNYGMPTEPMGTAYFSHGHFGEIKGQVSLLADEEPECHCTEAMRWQPSRMTVTAHP